MMYKAQSTRYNDLCVPTRHKVSLNNTKMPRPKNIAVRTIEVDPEDHRAKKPSATKEKLVRGPEDPSRGPLPGTIGLKKQETIAYIRSKGWQTPLEYLLQVMNDDEVPRDSRVDAAKAAAPFVHAKLQAVVIENTNDALDAEIKTAYRDALRDMKYGGAPMPSSPPL
jgi:hypothetical protein